MTIESKYFAHFTNKDDIEYKANEYDSEAKLWQAVDTVSSSGGVVHRIWHEKWESTLAGSWDMDIPA